MNVVNRVGDGGPSFMRGWWAAAGEDDQDQNEIDDETSSSFKS